MLYKIGHTLAPLPLLCYNTLEWCVFMETKVETQRTNITKEIANVIMLLAAAVIERSKESLDNENNLFGNGGSRGFSRCIL